MSYYPQLLQSRFTIEPTNRSFHLLFLCAYHATPQWVPCKPTKIINQHHSTWFLCKPSSKVLVLKEEGGGPRVVGCGCTETPKPTLSCNYKHTHTQTHRIYHGPLPCLPLSYVCVFCVFHLQQLHSSGSCVPSSSSLRRAERQHGFLSKNNAPRRPNLSPLLWQFITGSKLYTPQHT